MKVFRDIYLILEHISCLEYAREESSDSKADVILLTPSSWLSCFIIVRSAALLVVLVIIDYNIQFHITAFTFYINSPSKNPKGY